MKTPSRNATFPGRLFRPGCRPLALLFSVVLWVVPRPAVCAGDSAAVACWEFDGDLRNAAGRDHVGRSPKATFVTVDEARALAPNQEVTVPDAPALRLTPQFRVESRFRLTAITAEGPQVIITKDKEYLLRVDQQNEGSHLSFFVYADGKWEPRVRGPVAGPDTWYDLRASWDGCELMLEVNGHLWTRRHPGWVAPTTNPVVIGPIHGVIDRIAIENPGYVREALLRRIDRGKNPKNAAKTARFDAKTGWAGWRGVNGADSTIGTDNALHLRFPHRTALAVSPPLRLPAAETPLITVEADAPKNARLHLLFIGDKGFGAAPFSPFPGGRATLVDLAEQSAWAGTIHRLALVLSTPASGRVALRRLVAGNRLVGRPFIYVRNFAPEHAVLRVGRREKLIAVVKNLGGDARDVRVALETTPGIRILDGNTRRITVLPEASFDLVTWTVTTDHPGKGRATVRVAGQSAPEAVRTLPLQFTPRPRLEHTGYVPKPRPAQTDYVGLMHYCPLWKEGTHYGWNRIVPWPERRPAIGYYDEGTPEVADWHIKYALEHGIDAFIYCWYRADLAPDIHQSLGHAIHEGLFRARYRDRFHFCIMWENGCGKGVKDADDLLRNLFPFWLKNYFTHPSYLKIDNQPVLFVWRPEKVSPQLGGEAATRRVFAAMRRRCREAGFAGLRLVACLNRANPALQKRLAAEGWDATSGYAVRPIGERIVGTDIEGIPFSDHADTLRQFKETWLERRRAGTLPDIPNVMMGWDPRPWHGSGTRFYQANPAPEHFENACRDAKKLVDQTPADAWCRKLVVFDNWTEFGEGHYLEPTAGDGFAYVNAIKRVFCTRWAPEEITDVIPEDVGLPPPQKRYEAVRALYGGLPWRPRVIRNHLVAFWRFDSDNKALLLDSSSCAFHLRRRNAPRVPGKHGKAMQCGTGWASYPAHPAFFPRDGIGISLWCRPTAAGQSDRWMLNTVGNGANGYRLGLSVGRPCWQIPRERWSHLLRSPEPLPVNQWTHLAATFDNRTMRLYVNGKEIATRERPGLIRSSSADLHLGAFSGTRARFQGLLDEVRIFDRPLSPAEIADLAEQ